MRENLEENFDEDEIEEDLDLMELDN